jgi:hypothetical protein
MVTITEPPTQPSTPPITTNNHVTQTTTNFISSPSTATPPTTATAAASGRGTTRSRGVIFPSVKNKPSPANTTFTSDLINNIKDVKVSSFGKLPKTAAALHAVAHQHASSLFTDLLTTLSNYTAFNGRITCESIVKNVGKLLQPNLR